MGGGNQKVENNIATFHRIHWYQYFGNKNKTDNFDFRLYWKQETYTGTVPTWSNR